MRDMFLPAAVVFVVATFGLAQAAGRWDLAVYALSFWHYPVYALAFFWRRVPLQRFQRDALLLKTISMAALAYVFVMTVPNIYSLAAMIVGFGLNIIAAWKLGADRTYYGHELGGAPQTWITSFPYSVISHPMLIGNILAYGGMLLDGEFRMIWWPLALLHVVFNGLILVMEIYGRKSHVSGVLWPFSGLVAGSVLLIAGFMDVWPYALAAVLIGLIFGVTLFRRYSETSGYDLLREKLS